MLEDATRPRRWVAPAFWGTTGVMGFLLALYGLAAWVDWLGNPAPSGHPAIPLLVGAGLVLAALARPGWLNLRGARRRRKPAPLSEGPKVTTVVPEPENPAPESPTQGEQEAPASAKEAAETLATLPEGENGPGAGEAKQASAPPAPPPGAPSRMQTLAVTYTLPNGQQVHTTGHLFFGSRPFSLTDLGSQSRRNPGLLAGRSTPPANGAVDVKPDRGRRQRLMNSSVMNSPPEPPATPTPT